MTVRVSAQKELPVDNGKHVLTTTITLIINEPSLTTTNRKGRTKRFKELLTFHTSSHSTSLILITTLANSNVIMMMMIIIIIVITTTTTTTTTQTDSVIIAQGF